MSVLAALTAEELELATAAPPPRSAGAMKAVLTDARFSDPAWISERKLDGIRCIAIRTRDDVQLLSRNDLSLKRGALLLGYYRDGRFEYAGKVGTGFDAETLGSLGSLMRERQHDDPPFADAPTIRERDVTWVEPQLVAQIGFSEWTSHGRLRHPRLLGLRDDKAAAEVVREG